MSEEINNQQTTVTIPGLTAADAAYADMVIPVARGTGDYGLTVTQLQAYMQNALSPITEEERQKLQDLKNAPTDWSGTQSEYNALTSYDAGRWYFIVNDDAVIALFRGSSLVWAVPNCVGQFSDDSTADDWYWWPNGVKTALPVDPVTCRFSFYYPEVLIGKLYFYDPANPQNSELINLERIPTPGSGISLDYMPKCKIMPTIDCIGMTSLNYVLIGRSWAPTRMHFVNTDKIFQIEMLLNVQKGQIKILTGFDCSSLRVALNYPFSGGGPAYMPLANVGKAQAAANFDFRNENWGDDAIVPGARQTLVDSLITNSFDRATAGYGVLTLRLSSEVFARLTAEEVAAVTAKGYTITAE